MAFFSKAGSLIRQTVSNKHISREMYASSPSIFQMIRCMSTASEVHPVFLIMGIMISCFVVILQYFYVGHCHIAGLSYNTNDNSLREAFEKYGAVNEAGVILDRETGRSRGFGFITYTTMEEASSAIQALDGQELHGRVVKVNYANERERSPVNGYGGGGGGGYGNGGYGDGYRNGGYGGGGGYGNGGYGGGGSYGSAGGGYGGGNSYGSGGVGGYGGGDSYGSGGGNYGGGYETGGSTGGGSNVSYGSDAQNCGVAGGVGGGENYNTGFGTAGGNDFAASGGGHDGNTPLGYSGGNQFFNSGSSNVAGTDEGYSQVGPLGGNFRDDDDEPGEYANRRA